MAVHPSHPDIIKRLKRAEGHLRSIVTMLEEDRDCLEIAQQMQAVESAVANAKKTLVHDHIDPCLEHAVDGVGARDAISQTMAVCETVAASPSNTACRMVPRTATMKAAIIVFEWPGSRPCSAPSRMALGRNSQALPPASRVWKSVIGIS